MMRCERGCAILTIVALLFFHGCQNQPATESVSPKPVSVNDTPAAVAPLAASPPVAAQPSPPDAPEADVADAEDANAAGSGGSGGAPAPPPPELITREEYLAEVAERERLRADIRATNPKLQLIIDGKFDEFAQLLDEEPRLATLRWGYHENKPDPLNPTSPPWRGGPTALHLAANHGSLELVKRLATREVIQTSEIRSHGIESPLCFAANTEIAQVLVDAGAAVGPDALGDAVGDVVAPVPMRGAAQRGNLELCKWLFENGAELDPERGEYYRPIGFACEAGHLEIVQWFDAQGVSLVVLPQEQWQHLYVGSSPLAKAAAGGHVNVIEYLLANGAESDLNAQIERKATQSWEPKRVMRFSPSLCNAAANGRVEAAKLLLKEGARVTSDGAPNPLYLAALHGKDDVFNLLRENGAEITTEEYVTRVEENAGIDLLCCAVRGGNVAVFEQVTAAWPRDWVADDACADMYSFYKGRWTLAVAVGAGHTALVVHMLSEEEFTRHPERAQALNHALATAVETDRADMVKLLHAAGASLDEPLTAASPGTENAGQSVAIRAAAHGSLNVLRYLVEQGADIDERDDQGRTLLHRVCCKQFAWKSGWYADEPTRLEIISGLLELGANPNARDKSGRTILHDAVFHLEPAEISLLIEHRATPMAHDADGETPAAFAKRLLAGKYNSDAERLPWDEGFDEGPQEFTRNSWRERIRLEGNLQALQ